MKTEAEELRAFLTAVFGAEADPTRQSVERAAASLADWDPEVLAAANEPATVVLQRAVAAIGDINAAGGQWQNFVQLARAVAFVRARLARLGETVQ